MKVSIITPSLNQGRFIERTIQSVLSQNINDLEYIIIDGGSTDQTLDILKRYKNRVQFISEPDNGQSDAINKGLKMASGEIIGWLNSDDIYYPETIPKVCQFFATHPDIDIMYGRTRNIDPQDQMIDLYPTQPWDVKRLPHHCYISQPATFFRKSVLERFGFLDNQLNYCMDYEYWLRLAKKGAYFHYFPHILAGSRIYPETKTMSQAAPMQKEVLNMLKQHFGKVPSRWFLTYAYAHTKSTLKISRLDIRFLVKMFLTACQTALRINGNRQGIIDIFCFPYAIGMLTLRKLKHNLS